MKPEIPSKTEGDAAVLNSTRSRAPVFVLGCPRSGTTLLYHMLLSAGKFCIYRSETHAFNVLEPAYGDLSKRSNKKKLMKAWLDSKLFQLSGLDAQEIEAKVMADCKNAGDFLRIVMGNIARKQDVDRWADCTPDHLLYISRIKRTIPEALIVHIIRDGRDVALSLDRQAWVRPLPGDAERHLMVAALYWEWIVNRGSKEGRRLGKDYCEIRFEELVTDPRPVLHRLSSFLDQDLAYDRIRETAIGSVAEPNTSFQSALDAEIFNPVERWKEALSLDELRTMESLIGSTLRELSYSLGTVESERGSEPQLCRLRAQYRFYFDVKLWLKTRTPAGKYLSTKNLSWL